MAAFVVVLSILASLVSGVVALSIEVTSIADSGSGSLREAILTANANPGWDEVRRIGPRLFPLSFYFLPAPLPSRSALKEIVTLSPWFILFYGRLWLRRLKSRPYC